MVMDTDGAARLDERQLSGLHADLVLIGPDPALPGATGLPHHVVRTSSSPLPQTDIQWLGRHIARTKLGLALGAGGAKGFAHVGAFSVLEKAGYVFDYIAGSSIGSILGSGIAMGMSSAELLSTAHWLMSPEVCGTYFRLIKGDEEEPGHQRFYGALTAFADKRSFSDLPVPLAVMTADLNAKRPFVFQSGALEEALHAANQIGDDAIQARTQGKVVPHAFTHGTSEQRMRWFQLGLESGRIEDGDTFEIPYDKL
jgi:hypothetical protein